MVTMMMVVGGFGLLLGITRMVMFVTNIGSGEFELIGPRRSEAMMLNMVFMVFGLLVLGLGVLWTLAPSG